MANNNLTDAEIIKALECCSCETIMYCEDQCPFYKKCMKDEQLSKYALDLINRQKAKIKELSNNFNTQGNVCENLLEENTNLKAEIERLKELDLQIEISKKLEAEIKAEAYKECIDKIQNQIKNNNAISAEWLRKYLDNLLKELSGEYKPPKTETQIKFEAYRECIEKIKQRAEYCSYSVAVNTIADNVLKNLEGENKCE